MPGVYVSVHRHRAAPDCPRSGRLPRLIANQFTTRVGAIEPCREHICTPDCYNASGRHRQPELLSERSGMEIQKALFYRREYGKMKFFVEDAAEGPEGALLRLTRDEVGDEAELVTVSAKVYRDRGVVDFVGFLRKAIVTDPDAKVSPKSVWNAWTGRPADTAVDRSEEIGGIRFSDVQDIFSAVFDAGERVRGRLDGEVQRVWRGYRLHLPDESDRA